MKKYDKNTGITLIALVVTVIVMLILVGVSINMLAGQNGVLTKAAEASFRTEMADVKDIVSVSSINVMMGMQDEVIETKITLEDAEKWDISLKKEIINWGEFEIAVNELSDNYIKNNFNNLVADGEYIKDIYYIKDSKLKEREYIYNKENNIVYKIKKTRIGKYVVHSAEELDYLQNGGERKKSKLNYTKIEQNVEIRQVGNKKYYEPDLNNLAKEVTDLIFYKMENENITNEEYPVNADKWLNDGKPNQIEENGNTYILYDYEKQIWANIRIKTSAIETNWIWIPRYVFFNSDTITNIAFVDVSGNRLNQETGDFTSLKAFEGNQRKGMWVSKYEVIGAVAQNTSSYSYYIPDITGLDKENTYLEIYDEKAENFVDSVPLNKVTNISKFSQENNWFDYSKQRWANIKIEKNGIETWWVWIPRYSYVNMGNKTDIIFIDTQDKPIDGSSSSTSYTVPDVFKGNDKKGIWVSKYEPTTAPTSHATDIKQVPDLTGLITTQNKDKLKIYLEIYNDTKTGFSEEIELSNITDLEKFAKENKWYDYSKKEWANVKVVNTNGTSDTSDDIETWWVWIPRYAYNNSNSTTDVLLLDENNKMLNGDNKPDSYTIPEMFNGNKELGIWVSKYELTKK